MRIHAPFHTLLALFFSYLCLFYKPSLYAESSTNFAPPHIIFKTPQGTIQSSFFPVHKNLITSLAITRSPIKNIQIEFNTGQQKAPSCQIAFHDQITHLAFLETHQALEQIPELGESITLEVGAPLYLNPQKKEVSCRFVSREYRLGKQILPFAFYRVHFPPHQSPLTGTPLFNNEGQICAVVYQLSSTFGNGAYALPIEVIKHNLNRFKNKQHNSRCWIGVTLKEKNTIPYITSVRPQSPADQAGLKPGDILFKIGSQTITNYPESVNAFYFLSANEKIPFHILRGSEKHILHITPKLIPLSSSEPTTSSESLNDFFSS